MFLVAYSEFLNGTLDRLYPRQPAASDAEEYAVFASFLDYFLGSNQASHQQLDERSSEAVCVVNRTSPVPNPGSILPLDVVALGPEDMGHDFYRQNSQSWKIEGPINTRFSIRLISREQVPRMLRPTKQTRLGDAVGRPEPTQSAVFLSRAGFNRPRNLALLSFTYSCGSICGETGWATLRKVGTKWTVTQLRPTIVR